MDQAKIGLMLMGNGLYQGQQVLSSRWLHMMQEACDVAPYYGYLIWLNHDGLLFKDAPHTSWFAIGAGSSITWIDPHRELVCVMRWIDATKTNDCIAKVMQSLSL
jgi:CubicO group peptidase (beta-lactamase class C family)